MAQRTAARAEIYQIRVRERLDPHWSEWLDGLAVENGDAGGGDTILSGPIIDQAALHGVLMKIRDMGLTLLSVTRVDPGQDPLAAAVDAAP
jgi:hypothetical protein